MNVRFDNLTLGKEYTRPELAEIWGYASYEAISRGIVTPRDTSYIVLFITREKQEFLFQYEDQLSNGILNIEGETNHAADNRIIQSQNSSDEIYLFYRERHHSPFVYFGQVYLTKYEQNTEQPSRFRFKVPSEHPDDSLETELLTHGQPNEEFVPDPEGRKIIRQHVTYERSRRNRQRALEIHGIICLACGFDFNEIYGVEHARGYIEIHHVKSITKTDTPIDPEKDLIPLCPNCHVMAHRNRDKILSLKELKELIGS